MEGELEQLQYFTAQADVPQLPRLVIVVNARFQGRIAEPAPILIMVLLALNVDFGADLVLVRQEGEVGHDGEL